MDTVARFKEWINENVPMLSKLYENKYVGMLYDRFASLPSRQQRQWILGFCGGVSFLIMSYLAWSYVSYWSTTNRAKDAYSMANILVQYQKQKRDKSSSIRALARNNGLSSAGRLKQTLLDMGRSSAISPRMIAVEEKSDERSSDIQTKRATVTLTRVTLLQTTKYLKSVENGQFDLGITSLRITNDDKIRGYMKVELGIVAYLFQMDES